MSAYSGDSGRVYVGPAEDPTLLIVVKFWEYEDTAETDDSTGMVASGVTKKSFTPVLGTWQATIEGLLDESDTHFLSVETDPPYLAAGVEVVLELYWQGVPGGKEDTLAYVGVGLVKSAKPTVKVDGLVSFTVVVQGDGALLAQPIEPE